MLQGAVIEVSGDQMDTIGWQDDLLQNLLLSVWGSVGALCLSLLANASSWQLRQQDKDTAQQSKQNFKIHLASPHLKPVLFRSLFVKPPSQ